MPKPSRGRPRAATRKTVPVKRKARQKIPRKKRRYSQRHRAKSPAVITYYDDGKIVLVLPRRLKTPNKRGGFWAEHGERMAWERMLTKAKQVGVPVKPTHRQRMHVLRLTPSKRWLLDTENLNFSTKRLTDAMKAVGLIMEDNATWLDGPYAEQGISSDKCYWAIITLTPAEAYVDNVPTIDPKSFLI